MSEPKVIIVEDRILVVCITAPPANIISLHASAMMLGVRNLLHEEALGVHVWSKGKDVPSTRQSQ